MIYYGLEGGWRINKTYGYHSEFKKAVLVMERGFLFFSFRHPNEIKSSFQINFCKIFNSNQTVLKFIN